MKNVTAILAAGVLMMAAATVSARSCNGPKGPGRGHGPKARTCAQDLNLSQEQQEQLETLRKERREDRREWRADHGYAGRRFRDSIRVELLKESPDTDELDRFADSLGALHRERAAGMSAHMLKVKEILEPEQFEKMLERSCNSRNGYGKKHGRGHGRKHGRRKGGPACN
ncbi:MAG: Spy/CpxP family protein refolding chaperone [Fibrobacterota bacterium]|jgi:Spy/CpxP family protein refolding chaperone